MPPGKFAAQAAHACAQSLIEYLLRNPDHARHFRRIGMSGTRIILTAPHELALLHAHDLARAQDIPCALFYDSGHVLPPYFNGQRILTGLGVGPATKDELRPITKKFNLAA